MTTTIPPNIAVFDSGQGGLTVWENILKKFPNLNTQYLGDNARCPYGNKSYEMITHYASEAALFLSKRNAELLVVACGTASSVAVKKLQELFKIPVIGIVEGLCRQAAETLTDKTQTVAILGTQFTIKSQRFNDELNKYAITNIYAKACPLFVPLVEEGIVSGLLAEEATKLYLEALPKSTKVVLLACTHYPRLVEAIASTINNITGKPVIYKTIAGDVTLAKGADPADAIYILESSYAIVNYIQNFLSTQPNSQKLQGGYKAVMCTDSPEQFANVGHLFTSLKLPTAELVEL